VHPFERPFDLTVLGERLSPDHKPTLACIMPPSTTKVVAVA
jgi:hypothetical protein